MKQDDVRASETTLSKPEAVWRAIEELGYQAQVSEILEYVRTQFGIDANTPSEREREQPTQRVDSPPAAEASRKPAGQRKPRKPNDSSE